LRAPSTANSTSELNAADLAVAAAAAATTTADTAVPVYCQQHNTVSNAAALHRRVLGWHVISSQLCTRS